MRAEATTAGAAGLRSVLVRWLPRLALGYLTYRAATLAVNAATIRRLRPAGASPAATPSPGPSPVVSVLVPARNEEHTLAENLPGLLRQGAHEVIVLDDGSRDRTPEVAERCGARVVTGRELPPGWAGKPWACHQLAGAARGDVLIFTDADVSWRPGALAALLAELERTGAGLLSVFPRHLPGSVGERLLTPLVDAAFLGHLAAPLMRTRLRGAAAANGQVMAWRRPAYDSAGGHRAVRGHVVEDVRTAQLAHARGLRVAVALGGEAIEVRMYRSYAESVAGFAKSTPGMHGGSRLVMAGAAAWFVMTYTLPWLLPGRPLVWAARVAGLLDRAVVSAMTGRRAPADLAEGLLGPVTPLLVLPVYARALRGHVEWKGRRYAP